MDLTHKKLMWAYFKSQNTVIPILSDYDSGLCVLYTQFVVSGGAM